jgi:hypothetical protein
MNTPLSSPVIVREPAVSATRSIADLLAPLDRMVRHSSNLVAGTRGLTSVGDNRASIPHYVFVGPRAGDEPIRIGIFAAIHGDEPAGARALVDFLALLDQKPELASGYCLFAYPVCNPTGYEDNTRLTRQGRDLNREFWMGSSDPEVRFLENELRARSFHGIISLHTDDTSNGLYGFVRGATLAKHLLRPALDAAASILPRNFDEVIDGFKARNGIIRDGYPGILSAPPGVRPRPFEVILETPHAAPQYLQEKALVIALQTILAEYRKLIAYAPNL